MKPSRNELGEKGKEKGTCEGKVQITKCIDDGDR
jgi:hypothetical protein